MVIAAGAALRVDAIEIGTPMLMRYGLQAIERVREVIEGQGARLVADTKISDEGEVLAALAFAHGADAVSVVDGASTTTFKGVRAVANRHGGRIWVDLLAHTNPVVRARALAAYVDGFILHRPLNGLPPMLIEGLLAVDEPVRLAGGFTLTLAQEVRRYNQRIAAGHGGLGPVEGIIVGRAITAADDPGAAIDAFLRACRE